MDIIGLDFGNFNSFACFISDRVEGSRLGGFTHDLLPPGRNDGIPSVYYYSKRVGELCGENAVTTRARPAGNRLRYLKKKLGATVVLDGKTISCDEAITKVIQHCVRTANERLSVGFQIQTNKIYLAYPVTYSYAQLQKLIELAQEATLKDGTPVEVCGTIREPAAAALDYLSSFAGEDTTVLTYDLGGGTFDLALVAAYPNGKQDADGNIYYYDIVNVDGLENVGGKDFDEILYDLIKAKINTPLKPYLEEKLLEEAEERKKELTSDHITVQELQYEDEILEVEVSRSNCGSS